MPLQPSHMNTPSLLEKQCLGCSQLRLGQVTEALKLAYSEREFSPEKNGTILILISFLVAEQ